MLFTCTQKSINNFNIISHNHLNINHLNNHNNNNFKKGYKHGYKLKHMFWYHIHYANTEGEFALNFAEFNYEMVLMTSFISLW